MFTQDIEAPMSGALIHRVAAGSTVEVGAIMGSIEGNASDGNEVIPELQEEEVTPSPVGSQRSESQTVLNMIKFVLLVLVVLAVFFAIENFKS